MSAEGPTDPRGPLLAATLDTLVPAEDGFPGGSIALEHVAAVLDGDGGAAALLAEALAQIGRAAQRFPRGLAGLTGPEREALLREVERELPRPFAALVLHTYNGYYSHPNVVRLLGLPPEPPQPRGYALEPSDLALLERVRRRGPIYRPA
jgi:hypothetical protein